jgi:LysM repeat protein
MEKITLTETIAQFYQQVNILYMYNHLTTTKLRQGQKVSLSQELSFYL